jgi:hypothetical protein
MNLLSRDRLLIAGYGWIRPIASWRARAEERARALTPFQSAALLEQVRRDGDRQALLVLHQVATGVELWAPGRVRDADLIAAIEAAVAGGNLLLLRESPGGDIGARSVQSAENALIEAVVRGRRTLTFQDQRYFFAPAESWSGRDGGSEYMPMRAEAARDLVAGMEEAMARTPADHLAWQNLAAALTDPRSGRGILLLRYAPASSVPKPRAEAEPVTPSQLAAKIAEQDWIELQLQWDDGTPFDGDFLLTLPGGRTTGGPPDEGGLVRVDSLESGACKLTYPDQIPAP